MSDHIERLRAWRQYKDRHETDELRDALALLDDYDELRSRLAAMQQSMDEVRLFTDKIAARLAEAERRLKNYEPTNLYNGLTIDQWKARCDEAEGREQMLLNRCDVLEEERNDSDNRLADAEAVLQLIAGYRQAVAFFAPQLAGVVAALDRIDAHLSRKEQP